MLTGATVRVRVALGKRADVRKSISPHRPGVWRSALATAGEPKERDAFRRRR